MKESYRTDLKAHVLTNQANRVRAIRHTQEYWESPTGGGLMTAASHLRQFAGIYEIPTTKFDRLEIKVTYLDPREQGEEYRLSEERYQFDSETFGFYQTFLNVPVWRAGLKMTLKQGPNRVIRSKDTSQQGVNAKMPSKRTIDRYRNIFTGSNIATAQRRAVMAQPDLKAATLAAGESAEAESEGENLVRGLITLKDDSEDRKVGVRLIRGRFWIYRYDADARMPEHDAPDGPIVKEQADANTRRRRRISGQEVHNGHLPPFDIPDVDPKIKDGTYYMVAEITFEVLAGGERQVWRALVELNTNSILYLRPMSAHVNGYVYENDPITQSGSTTPDSDSNNATLNPYRYDVPLQNLDAPVNGTQSLSVSFAEVTQIEGADITPPTESTGTDFDYAVRTKDFASVNGYFHVARIFRTLQDLGFNVSTYMSNTVFPIPVDIRCFDAINAHCVGDGIDGIGHTGYGLMDTTDTTNPLGRACDPRVHLHEVLGHGVLYEAVDSPNMGFTHSAGDSLSLIYFDPDSQCKGVDGSPLGKPGDLRFTYVPWHPSLNRRCDRNVADGWAWNGSRDNGGYGSEEILATTLFNFYRSIGGDHQNLGRRQFASRMAMYLILRAIGNLTPATDGTITTAGDPPDVDVYIDDGRAGEYPFQHVHWHTTTIWNRRAADDIDAHQEPELDLTNYAYVKIKNRGTQQAQNVVVYGYHTKPGAGLNWPVDFDPFTTASINVGTVNANNTQEVVVGPFEWTPNINAYGHDCMLIVATADGDASNKVNKDDCC
ncbi:hypothetical protein HNR65_002824 [Desulfosalsimonas propionicica]|uniref:Uncharacterized protein n=1 Tax=Desulfosalsimonas propionicica TaxID=332175 RepID=A0A7W0CB28_9BACT|nr:hypothetical protein [Desulfosalsimonas propionicica]MBA2882472.1 hypothetical protein [Desulfosalsimonas propionicica]